MFYRVALGFGLLLLGAVIGRELRRTAPVRKALQTQRRLHIINTPPATKKMSLH